MKNHISQLLIMTLVMLSLVGQVFAENLTSCDMSHDTTTESTGHAHHMADMPTDEGTHEHQHHDMMSMPANSDADSESMADDCCETECKCQHGVCASPLFLTAQVINELSLNANTSITHLNTFFSSVVLTLPLRPPIS